MSETRWLWWAIGAAGMLVFFVRPRREPGLLGLPLEGDGPMRTTPKGSYGAPRKGPPVHKHQGVDLRASPGSRVLAIGDGVIVRTNPGLGKTVRKLRLDRPAAWASNARRVDAVVYADLGRPLVEPADRVRRGDAIAFVDRSGFVHVALKEIRGNKEIFFDPKEAGFPLAPSPRKET